MDVKRKSRTVAREIEQGSSETFDKTCEVCDGIKGGASQQTEAVNYYEQCQQYLCNSCCS